MVFKWCISKCFQKSPTCFNGFQMMCFKVFSKILYGFQWFSNCMFSKCASKCFQIVCFKPFSNYIFQSVFFFKIHHRFQSVFKLCVSMVFKIAKLLKVFQIICGELDTQFENHWNLWGILKILWNTFWKDTIWNPLKPMGNFENTLKHLIWKHFETHHLKTLWNTLFENTLKHIIWKPLKPMGDFWKHFETYYLKTLWNTHFEKPLKHLGDFWKHFENHIDTPLSCHHSGVTIETLCFQLALKWNTWGCAVMHGKKICFFHAVEIIDFTTTVWSNKNRVFGFDFWWAIVDKDTWIELVCKEYNFWFYKVTFLPQWLNCSKDAIEAEQ